MGANFAGFAFREVLFCVPVNKKEDRVRGIEKGIGVPLLFWLCSL